MRTGYVLVLLAVLGTVAGADTLKVKLRPSTGEFVKFSHKPCSDETRSIAVRIVSPELLIEIDKNSMKATLGKKSAYATRVVPGDIFYGFFDRDDGRRMFITVYRKKVVQTRQRRPFLIHVDVGLIETPPGKAREDSCVDVWKGLGQIL